MGKFKVGDKVRVVDNYSSGYWEIGYVGHITDIISRYYNTPISIEVDGDKTESGCWYTDNELEKFDD